MAESPPGPAHPSPPPDHGGRAGRAGPGQGRSVLGVASIPVSLVLVVSAAVLLFVALSGEEHRPLIWTSLGLAVLAVAALAVAVVRRRGQGTRSEADDVPDIVWPLPAGNPPPLAAPLAEDDAPAAPDEALTRPASDPRDPADEPPIEVPTVDVDEAGMAGIGAAGVAVIDGRPRYHLPSCGFLTGRQAVSIPLSEARASGFTPCGRCRPVAALLEARAHLAPPGGPGPDAIDPGPIDPDGSPPGDPPR